MTIEIYMILKQLNRVERIENCHLAIDFLFILINFNMSNFKLFFILKKIT